MIEGYIFLHNKSFVSSTVDSLQKNDGNSLEQQTGLPITLNGVWLTAAAVEPPHDSQLIRGK